MKRRVHTAWLLVLAVAALFAAAAGIAAEQAAADSKGKVTAKAKRGTLEVDGTNAGEEIVLRLRAGDPNVLEVVTSDGVLSFARSGFTKIEVQGDDGDDLLRIDEANGAFTNTEATTLAGEDDDDDLRGGSGAEALLGGSDDDKADGNQGADSAFMGSGDDSFTWDPGDGSDRVEGGRGDDTLVFNGSSGAENFDASANGKRLRFFRSAGNIVMDVDDTERIDLRTLGGTDSTVMNDLRRTDVEVFDIDLAAALGGSAGDGVADTVTLFGSDSASRGADDDEDDDDDGDARKRRGDEVSIVGAEGSASVDGLSALVRIAHADAALDQLTVDTRGGDDEIDAARLGSSAIKLVLEGGPGDDALFGGSGNDTLNGGDGDDSADGNAGADTANMGAGDDSFTWDPGDGSDIVEGQDGSDTMIFNGSGGNELFEYLANGDRLKFTRSLGSIVMDVEGVEQVDLEALGGADIATVNSLAGTDVARTNIDLEGALGSGAGDGQPDQIVVNGTAGPDNVTIDGGSSGVEVDGLVPEIEIQHAEAANDKLTVSTLAGIDSVNASGLDPGAIQLTLDGGADGDSLSGSQGGDRLIGGAGVDILTGNDGDDAADGDQGNDTAHLGDGDDDFTWDPGDGSDVVEGQDGTDRMIFNGAAGNEIFTVNAVGSRVEFLRNLGLIDMDLDDVERIDLDALGGTDQTIVNDLSGTDMKDVNVDVEAVIDGGAPDGLADTVTVNATNGVDTIDVSAVGGETVVTGLAATVRVAHADPLLDQLILNTLAGIDQVNVGAGVSALIGVTVNQ